MEGFFLGLANGTVCAVYCIPALLAYYLKEGKTTRQNYLALVQFMAGRFAGYLFFSLIAWFVSITLFRNSKFNDLFFGGTYLILSFLLLSYGLSKPSTVCGPKLFERNIARISNIFPSILPLTIGIITGLNICPPFLLVFTRATSTGTLWGSMLFFIMFFLGTSVYFIPAPLAGYLNRFPGLRTIGKYAVFAMVLFYIALGIVMIGRGFGIIQGLNFDKM